MDISWLQVWMASPRVQSEIASGIELPEGSLKRWEVQRDIQKRVKCSCSQNLSQLNKRKSVSNVIWRRYSCHSCQGNVQLRHQSQKTCWVNLKLLYSYDLRIRVRVFWSTSWKPLCEKVYRSKWKRRHLTSYIRSWNLHLTHRGDQTKLH